MAIKKTEKLINQLCEALILQCQQEEDVDGCPFHGGRCTCSDDDDRACIYWLSRAALEACDAVSNDYTDYIKPGPRWNEANPWPGNPVD